MKQALSRNQGLKSVFSDDELCAWWAAEGSTSFDDTTLDNFEYLTQDGKEFAIKYARELRQRGYRCKIVEVKPGSYALRADHASNLEFIRRIILPRRKKIPKARYQRAAEAYHRLLRTRVRGLGKPMRGKLR